MRETVQFPKLKPKTVTENWPKEEILQLLISHQILKKTTIASAFLFMPFVYH